MAKASSTTKREPVNPGLEFTQNESDINRYPVHTLPLMLAPIDSLGLKVCLGLNGWPSNRTVTISGPPHSGKSLLTWAIADQYVRNDDLVVVSEVENALDRNFMAASFHFDAGMTEEDKVRLPLEYLLIECEKTIDQQKALNDPETQAKKKAAISDAKKEVAKAKKYRKKVDKDVAAAAKDTSGPVMLPERIVQGVIARRDNLKRMLKGEPIVIPDASEEERLFGERKLLETAQVEFKLRKVLFTHPGTMEEFEREFFRIITKRHEKEDLRNKRLFWIVDSASALLPDSDMEKKASSEGNKFGAAAYFRTLLPRLNYEIGVREISIAWVNHQNVFLTMNPYEFNDDIKKIVHRGGDGLKFGATMMITTEIRKDALDLSNEKIKAGRMEIPKSKLRGGSSATLEAIYFIHEGNAPEGYFEFDLDTPLLLEILGDDNLKKERLGLLKAGHSILVPEKLLIDHPDFKEAFEPKLQAVTEANGTRYYKSNKQELIDDAVLIKSPSFHKAVIMEYEIAGTI